MRDDQILMIRRGRGPAQGKWSIPGGRVEFGETLEEAVIRELAEETGLGVICGSFLGISQIINEDVHMVIHDFTAELEDEFDIARPGDDAQEVRWVGVFELGDYDVVDGLVEFLYDHGIVNIIS